MSLYDRPFVFDELLGGDVCPHVLAAVAEGIGRLKQLSASGASNDQLEAEVAATDPLVKLYLMVEFQRLLYFQSLVSRTIGGSGGLLGFAVETVPTKTLYPHFDRLSEMLFDHAEAIGDRLSDLHEEGEDGVMRLKRWSYAPLARGTTPHPAPLAPDTTTTPVALSDDDKSRSDNILSRIFGGLSRGTEPGQDAGLQDE